MAEYVDKPANFVESDTYKIVKRAGNKFKARFRRKPTKTYTSGGVCALGRAINEVNRGAGYEENAGWTFKYDKNSR
jgi:hypothetical protein